MSLRIVSFHSSGSLVPGVLVGEDRILPLIPALAKHGIALTAVRDMLALWPSLAPLVSAEARTGDVELIALDSVRLGPPLPDPGQVIAVGFNYGTHSGTELELTSKADPVVFMKSPASVSGPNDEVVRPLAAQALDYEAEVAIVIGRPGHRIGREQAAAHIAGFMLANDVTARDIALPPDMESPLQAQIVRGKGYPTFCPTGPWLLTVEPGAALPVFDFDLYVNSELRQVGTTEDLVLGFAETIESVSAAIELRAGDVILTGTPGGCGFQMTPPRYLAAGDDVRASSDLLGEMRWRVRDEQAMESAS
ncbi:fumarylacetoacetate hydrolase family protein [Nocardia sp. NPDC059228]|uniref:fumarylacetoacetate hydrolase family protein n=1 Tax=Nocardia sp. NPDC059228 TaxID=3346777 RepID=UPI0036BA486A